jgi:hypothetical protein
VVGFEVVKIESPAFGGRSFGGVGSYDRILARATIAVDPLDRHNAAVEASARRLVEDRLLLDEDARRIVERAAQAM